MSTLNLVTTGLLQVPDLMIVYGTDGVGKSTFASKAPNPIFIGPEKGTARLNVARFPQPKTLRDVYTYLDDLYKEQHPYQTVCIDSLDWIEPLVWEATCAEEGVANIEQVEKGFGKGYLIALKQWNLFRALVNRLQETKKMNVIMIAHAEVKTFTDPTTNSAYDRYQLKLDKRAAALMREWAHFVGFANFRVYTKGKENAAKHRAYGDGTRTLYTERRPAFDAKNRDGLPFEIQFDYDTYKAAQMADPAAKAAVVKENIEALLKDTTDEAFKKLVRETMAKAKDNATDLILIQERLRAKLEKESENVPAAN